MNIPVIWIVIGIVLIIAEIFTPGFFLASLGLGAIAAGLAAFLSDSIILQLILFAAVSALSLVFLRPLLNASSKNKEKSGNEAVIGSEGIVIEEIDNLEGKGRVKVNGQEWKAKSMHGTELAAGTVIIVEKIEGVTLFVERR